ncbi:MAG TPA: VOC family protein [Allosphingosinicella sp.]|jgi:catechol 2,3-dioxygenase-like lactoylglutathione lyase family enzyme
MAKAVPVLASADLERTRKFYRYFGFEPVAEPICEGDEEPSWLRLRREGVELDFSLTDIDYTHDDFMRFQRLAVIRVADIHSWYDVFAKTRMGWKWIYPSLTRPRQDMWDGRWAFCLTDRDGNLIWCVEEPRSSSNPTGEP